jgi:hypothetical protein
VIDYFKGLVTGYQPVLNPKPETINPKQGGIRGKHIYRDDEVTDDKCQEIADKYSVSIQSVLDKREDMKDWSKSNDQKKADWELTLMKWMRDDIKSGKIKKVSKVVVQEKVELSPEQRARNLARLDEVKKGLLEKHII